MYALSVGQGSTDMKPGVPPPVPPAPVPPVPPAEVPAVPAVADAPPVPGVVVLLLLLQPNTAVPTSRRAEARHFMAATISVRPGRASDGGPRSRAPAARARRS